MILKELILRMLLLAFLTAICTASSGQIPIDTTEAVRIGNIQQWIRVQGSDRGKPILLFLHGGPGNSVMGYANRFTSELQKHFVVVQWDQRESGVTAKLNRTDRPLSVSLMEADAIEMVMYLRTRFSKDKIYLMGHSWGGFLGLLVSATHPELLAAYIAVSPMVNQVESERLSLQWMVSRAKATHNDRALAELGRVKIPFESGLDLYYHRRWLADLSGNKIPEQRFVENWADQWLPLFNEASKINFFEFAPHIDCPIYFMVGSKDYQTHFQITQAYYDHVQATEKRFFWFDDSGHSIPTQYPDKLQDIVIHEILEAQTR